MARVVCRQKDLITRPARVNQFVDKEGSNDKKRGRPSVRPPPSFAFADAHLGRWYMCNERFGHRIAGACPECSARRSRRDVAVREIKLAGGFGAGQRAPAISTSDSASLQGAQH